MFREEIAADENRHAPGDFAHRLQQRQATVHFNGFIGQTDDAGFQQRFSERTVGRQVQISEQHLARSQQRVLGRLRFLHLHQQLRLFEHPRVPVHQQCAGLLVIAVGIARARARAAFDDHPVPALGELVGRRGQERDAIFLVFDFPGDADDHARVVSPK